MSDGTTERHVAVVKAAFAAFARGDVEAALVHVAPDAELRPPGTSVASGVEVYRGHDGIRRYFADVARVWPEGLHLEPVSFRAVAGSVVVFGRVHGSSPQLGAVDDEVVWVWKLRDGLLVSGQIFPTRRAAIAAARAS